MSRKPESTSLAFHTRRQRPVFRLGDGTEIGVENRRTVQFDLDVRATNRDLLKVPLAGGPQVTSMRRNESVHRTVILPRIELSVLGIFRIEYL